jgi:PUA domain protein
VYLRYLSKRESRELLEKLKKDFKLVQEFDHIIVSETVLKDKKIKIYIGVSSTEKIPLAIDLVEEFIPAIHALNKDLMKINYVKIDQGAMPRILNGADVMAPGIVETSDFKINDLVGVREFERSLYIAVGKALMSSEEIRLLRRGKAVKTIHYAGDIIWRNIIDILKKI